MLNDIDRSRANESAAAAEQYGVRALVIAGDAGRASVARRMAESGKRVFGAVQILVNNAGVSGSSLGDNTVTTARPGAWEAVLKANLGPVFECSRFAIPLLIKAGGGAVVNISSVLALTGSAEFFRSHGYIASKGAIVSLTRAMAAAYAENNIRVNALCPGLIATAMAERARGRSDLMTYVAQKQKLLRGMGSAEAVAQAALFLTSDEAAEITGVILPIDGGWTSGY